MNNPDSNTRPDLGHSEFRIPNSELAIVGLGCLFPKADGPGAYWANVKHGDDCIAAVPGTHWNPDDYFDADPKTPDMTYARRGGFLSTIDFNPMEFGLPPKDIEATDTTQLLGLVAAKQALVDAGILPAGVGDGVSGIADKRNPSSSATPHTPHPTPRDKISVILGVTGTLELVIPLGARLGHPHWKRALKDAGVPDDVAKDVVDRIGDAYVPWQENSFPGLLGNVVAGRIANKLDLHGTNCVVDAACASSLSAVHLAALELQTGKADAVVTGGADTFNDIFMFMCFSKTPALSKTGDARPFDADGDGTILGEGLGMIVLKRLSDAERDGDTIYAVLKGIGSSSDGKGNAIYAPSADGQKRCLHDAYARAGVTPDTIEMIEAHGTGTKVGDATEATALTDVFSRDAKRSAGPWCAIGSVKSQVGHTKAAAGAASLIKAALALHYKVLPPTLKVTRPVDPLTAADSPFYVNTQMRPWLPTADHPRRAGVSAFGFGGSNFHAVLEEYQPTKREVDWSGRVELYAMSAASPQELAALLVQVPTTWAAFARAAETSRANFRADAECRLVLVAERDADLAKLTAAAKDKLAGDPNATAWHTSGEDREPVSGASRGSLGGAYYGRGPAGQLAVLFPGQGSQAVGMLRELACLFPEVLDTLALVPDVAAKIYPPTSFAADAKQVQDDALRATDVAQPAIGAVSYGAWRLLSERFGLAADAFAGHSYGELVALAAAGRFDAGELFQLSRLRGELMAKQGQRGDAGTMLAVLAPLDQVEAAIADSGADVVVANKNAPKQTVVSGPTAEIEKLAATLSAKKLRSARLPVAAAFHSPLVADAAEPFRAALDAVPFRPAAVPVFANTTAAEYPADPAAARELLGRQLAKPVAFVEQVRAMADRGVRTFLEVGPGGVLTKLVGLVLAEVPDAHEFQAVALDGSAGRRSGVLDLAAVLAQLAARGHAVDLAAWEAGSRCRPAAKSAKAGLTVPLSGANYVTPRPKRPARPPLKTPSSAGIAPMPDPTPLSTVQQTLAALQKMQEETARLHRQFLESQMQAQQTLAALVAQQSGMAGGLPPLPAVPAAPVAVTPPPPRPVAVVPPPVPVPLPPPPAPLPPPVAVKPSANGDHAPAASGLSRTLLEVVSEKTGYPVDMLSLGMTLDGDLGIDSIKRVEILSALQDQLPGSAAVRPEHLGQLHTLQDVADLLAGGPVAEPPVAVPVAVPVVAPRPTPIPPPQPASDAGVPIGVSPDAATDAAATLLAVVSEKTGYPVDMLSLGMTLDGDLGIDSIKRVEILSALQDQLPGSAAVRPEHLGQLHTLQDVADLLAGGPAVLKPQPVAAAGPSTQKVSLRPDELVAPVTPSVPLSEKDSHALDVIARSGGGAGDLDDLDSTSTVPRSELVAPKTERVAGIVAAVTPDSGLAPAVTQLEPVVAPRPADAPRTGPPAAEAVERSIVQVVDFDQAAGRAPVPLAEGGEVWLVADEEPFVREIAAQLAALKFQPRVLPWTNAVAAPAGGNLAGLVLVAPANVPATLPLNRLALQWLQAAGPRLRGSTRQGASAVLVSVARLDGTFGLTNLQPGADPTAGGLAGVVKTARWEWPELACKAIDVQPGYAAEAPASAAAGVVEEVLAAGPIEVGISPSHRCTLELARTARRSGSQAVTFGPPDVVLVTGGARGVTAEVAVALAEAFRPTLVLTGRTPAPVGPEPAWLAGKADEAGMKQAIAAHLGADASPKAVGEQFVKLSAQREIRTTLARLEAAGAKAAYFAVNVSNGRAVADLLHQVKVKFGTVTGVVHGAGVLADRKIEQLTPEQFDAVYNTKVEGVRNLLDMLGGEPLKAIVLFSSITGRLGRSGQLAYAAANEVLNKIAGAEARKRPTARVVAINWGPWEGGMVTPGLRKLFESEGVGLIPLKDGGTFAVQELAAAGRAVEVVAMGPKPRSAGSGAVAVPAAVRPQPAAAATPAPLTGPPPPAADFALAFERTVDVASHPILRSHVLDGRAVLPMALHMEWLAHAALHGNPGLVFHGFNDLRITHGVMVEEHAASSLRLMAGRAVKNDLLFTVPVELRGRRRDGRDVIHSRAEVVLTSALPKTPTGDRPPDVQPYPHPLEDVYRYFLFHGPDMHGIEAVEGVTETAFVGTAYPSPAPAEWFRSPLRSAWVADPLVLDTSFQMMILWSYSQHGAGSLPCFLGRYRQYRRAFPAGPTKVVIRVTRDDGSFARADIDFLDAEGQVVAQVQDYECVIDPGLNQAFRRNQLGPLVRQ